MLVPACMLLLLSGCGSEPQTGDAVSASETALNHIWLEQAPTEALSVQAARATLAPGDAVVVRGQIGGMTEPFFDGFAGFVLADTDLTFCDEMGDNHCATPWDACCEDPDKLQGARLTVQFIGPDGIPLDESLKSLRGLTGLNEVIVVGKVAEQSTAENLLIDATGLYQVR